MTMETPRRQGADQALPELLLRAWAGLGGI